MSVIKLLFTGIILWLEKLKGRRRVLEVTPAATAVPSVLAVAVDGHQLEIFCRKRTYRQEYARWYFPGRDYASFQVTARVSHDAPTKLKKAAELNVSFPAFFSDLVVDDVQQTLAVNAYLDLLKVELERLNVNAMQPA